MPKYAPAAVLSPKSLRDIIGGKRFLEFAKKMAGWT